jgi:hypothetical protein
MRDKLSRFFAAVGQYMLELVQIKLPAWSKSEHGKAFGCALAIAISWSVNHSIIWAIVHGAFSWFYVLYFAITR